MGWRHPAGVGLIAAMLGSNPALALGPSWGYVDYFRVWGRTQVNESGVGEAARMSLPLGEFLYFAAAGERLDARYDPSGSNIAERFEVGSAGLGLHTSGGTGHLFGVVSYVDKKRVQYAPPGAGGDHAAGVGVAIGARWLATPYLSIEPQGGLKGYALDGFLKLTGALRVLPHVWVAGEFSHNVFSGNEYLAGFRFAWSDYTPSRPPGASVVAAPQGDALGGDLVPWQTLVTLRPLVPQVRPAAGAPEMAPIPKGAKIVLQESITNEFGTWWRIGAGDPPEWIRETDLKGRP